MAVELKKLIDTRIDSASTLSVTHDAVLGPSNLVRQTFRPTSSSPSNLDFTIQTPGLAVYMSRKVQLEGTIPFEFTIRNYGEAFDLETGVDVGVCAFPGNSMIQTASVQINTSNFTTQLQQTLPLVKRLLQRPETRRKFATPSTGLGDTLAVLRQEQSTYFQSTVATGSDPRGTGCYGNASEYNLKLAQTGIQASPGAGLFTDTVIKGTLRIYEPLLCQPFEFDDEQPAFINVNTVSVRLMLSGLGDVMCRILRFASSPTIAGDTPHWQPYGLKLDTAVDGLFGDMRLACNFFSPPPTAVVPTKSIYPTTYMNPLPTGDNQTTSQDDYKTVISNVITLNTAPDAIAVYFVPQFESPAGKPAPVSPVSDGRMLQLEDYVSYINSLEITWNNNPSLLRTFTAQDLWERSHQNGLPQNWNVSRHYGRDNDATRRYNDGAANAVAPWTGGILDGNSWGGKVCVMTGSPYLLALNKDIPVEPGVAAGVAGVYTLQVRAELRSSQPNMVTDRGTFYVVPIYSQYLILNAGATSDLLTTVATEEQVASTTVVGAVQDKDMSGGSAQHVLTSKLSAARAGSAFARGAGIMGGMAMGAGDSAGSGVGKRMRL